jgi:Histidine kinase-like ATPase domain
MTAHRAASQPGIDVRKTHHDRLLADVMPCQAGHHGPASRPAEEHSTTVHPVDPAANHVITPRPEAVRIARDFIRSTLRSWGMPGLIDDAVLVVSELVTNALRHGMPGGGGSQPGAEGGPAIRLRLLAQHPYLMCMVSDPSREIPLCREADPEDCSGRGLHVIESCCSRWGWNLLDEGGKVVWALLPHG